MEQATSSTSSQPVQLTTEHAPAPLDVDVAQPLLAWQLPGVALQFAYQIVVATDPSLLTADRPDAWDSGRVVSTAQTNIPYGGRALLSDRTYFWAVRIWTSADAEPGAWSAPARFETGLLHAADWTANWIGRDNPAVNPPPGEQAPAPLLRKAFTLDGTIARARLRIVGLGHNVAFINGRRVGSQVLDPPPSAFDQTALYATHDVTGLLRRGDNVLGVMLGRGYFSAPANSGNFMGLDVFNLGTASWHSEPRLLAQLDIHYGDGRGVRVVSDGSWWMADGPLIDSAWEGEHYDARREQRGWTDVGFDARGWWAAPVQPAPTRRLRAMAMESIENTAMLSAVALSTPAPGVTVHDFGRTTAGWAEVFADGDAGTTLTLTYGETLTPEGTVATLTPQAHVDSYTLAGRGEECWEPSFARHGFRFIQLSSAPLSPAAVTLRARVNHTAVAAVGRFESDSDLLNRLLHNQRASLLANLWGFPTDTPWRDRMGWTADGWLYFDSAACNFDVQRLFRQWLRTWRESQRVDGSLPVFVPCAGITPPFVNDPSWSGTLVLLAWAHYQQYGDLRILLENYAAMVKWMDLIAETIAATGYIYRGFSFGDWASPGAEADGAVALVPPEGTALSATADLCQQARTLARIAALLDHEADEARFDGLAETIGAAFNAAFFDAASDSYRELASAGYRQTSNLLPLVYGLVPAGREQAVYAGLVADIRARGNHLNTGAIGTRLLLPVLTERGDGDLAFAIATQTSYPSWGYWLSQGATSSWETWSHTGPLQSQNHAFLGTFDEWLYRHLAGLQPAAPGYAAVRVKPFVPAGLNRAFAAIATVRGALESGWQRVGNGLELRVLIPGNTPAEIHVPAAPGAVIAVDGEGEVQPLRREDGFAVYQAGAGVHRFRVGVTG